MDNQLQANMGSAAFLSKHPAVSDHKCGVFILNLSDFGNTKGRKYWLEYNNDSTMSVECFHPLCPSLLLLFCCWTPSRRRPISQQNDAGGNTNHLGPQKWQPQPLSPITCRTRITGMRKARRCVRGPMGGPKPASVTLHSATGGGEAGGRTTHPRPSSLMYF
jgi:hypothetical protein